MVEQWLPVVGWEDLYEVSDAGQIRGFKRRKILKWQIDRWGYPRVKLFRNSRPTDKRIHRAVVEAFLGPTPVGLETRHRDSNKLNPSLLNLIYGTRSENAIDLVDAGNHYNARKTKCPSGHDYTEENTRLYRGRRYCRACTSIWNAAAKQRKEKESWV